MSQRSCGLSIAPFLARGHVCDIVSCEQIRHVHDEELSMPTMVREPPAGTRIDLPRFYTGDYQATFARLRATDPVHWQADTEMWIVTRHADIKTVTADTSTFSNNYGVTVGAH